MRCYFFSLMALLFTLAGKATGDADSTIQFNIPDSVKAIQFLAEINVQQLTTEKEVFAGIRTDQVKLSLESEKKSKSIVFEFPSSARVMAQGLNTDAGEKGEIEWDYDWKIQENYRLLISIAPDSAGNFVLYSGYAWLPSENKWKLIGTCKIEGIWSTIKQPEIFTETKKKNEDRQILINTGAVWIQRSNNSWKNLQGENQSTPVINLYPHIDSLEQANKEIQLIEKAIANGKTDAKLNSGGVYYAFMKDGNGKQLAVTDTVTVFYKGYLLADGSVFDETKEKPATFPLKRLIRGWQVGLPLARVGSKIKLLIPSGLAYSIRTRAARIPPNSILVFEIEVIDAKMGL